MLKKEIGLGGGFQYFFDIILIGEIFHFEYSNIFQLGWNHHLVGRMGRMKTQNHTGETVFTFFFTK